MNKQKQNVAMARFDGWVSCPRCDERECAYNHPPDYFTDNEIDRMVRGLDTDKCYLYLDALEIILATCEEWRDLNQIEVREFVWLKILKASPEQKVEAYLKAKGAWEDEVN